MFRPALYNAVMQRIGLLVLALVVGAIRPVRANDTFTLLLVGDTALTAQNVPVQEAGVQVSGRLVDYASLLAGVSTLHADVVIANLEAVITTRNDLPAAPKKLDTPVYFRAHPAGVRALLDVGIRVFSLANNHAFDYGEAGVHETLLNLAALRSHGLLAVAGLGLDRSEASRPATISVGPVRVGFASIGIVTNDDPLHRATERRPGSVSYRHSQDWDLVQRRLSPLPADFRVLAVHYGKERQVSVDSRQRTEWPAAARQWGIDVIVGHHAHVVRGIERVGRSVVFYGLGNFVHPGTVDMTAEPAFRLCRDFGLAVKLHIVRTGAGYQVAALEAFPITKTHAQARLFASAQDAASRIAVVNYLSRGLGANAVRFVTRDDGSGLYCDPIHAPRLGALCRVVAPARASVTDAQIANACHERNSKRLSEQRATR